MTSTGYNVMGWGVDPETMAIKQDTVQALRIMSSDNLTYPPEATYRGTVSGILDKNDTDVNSEAGKTVNLNLYDALGYEYTARFILKSTDNTGEYSVELTKLLDAKGNEVSISGATELFGQDNKPIDDETPVTFASGYKWATTGTDSHLELQDTNGTTIVDFSKLDFTSTDETAVAAVNKAYAAIAKAYGYEGNVDGFLNLYISDGASTPTLTKIQDLIEAGTSNSGKTIADLDGDGVLGTVPAGGTDPSWDFKAAGRYINGMILKFDTDTGLFHDINGNLTGDTTINLSKIIPEGATNTSNFSDIKLNWAGISMFNNNGTSTVTATYGDKDGIGTGRKLGDMIGVSIQRDGMIYASYDNGMTKLLGQIATANFPNASGLEKHGDNLYSSTMNSGSFDGIGVDVTASGGYMSTGVLEMSNVDLSREFTEMITTQRGFQANSRIITVSDTLLEELTNLKR